MRPNPRWDPSLTPELLIADFLAQYYAEAGVYIEQYMQTMHQALEASGSKLTNTNDPISAFLTPAALLTAGAILKDAESAALTARIRRRVQTVQLSVYYPVLLRWWEMRAYADNASVTWPFSAEKSATLSRFVEIAESINLTNLMEPDTNYHPPTHNVGWFVKIVNCNCSWAESCCKAASCCGSHPPPPPPPPSPPPPSPPAPPTPSGQRVSIKPLGVPVLINASSGKVAPTGMAHFAETLYRFPGGQLFTAFDTACDVCKKPSWTSPGRSFFSKDNGSSWREIEPIAGGGQHWKACAPGNDPISNSLTCFAYFLSMAEPANNRTGAMLTTRFEVDSAGDVRQVSVHNSTVGWPAPGLIPFGAAISAGNWFMVQDGNPLPIAKGEYLLPFYGEWKEFLLPPNTTHQNQKGTSNVLALVKNTDASLTTVRARPGRLSALSVY